VVIRSRKGLIFGGYTSKEWKSSGDYVEDEKAFIFSLKEGPDQKMKFNVKNEKANQAIMDHKD
jgi:hypothetical protein